MSIKSLNYYTMLGIYSKKTLRPNEVVEFVCSQIGVPRKKLMTHKRFRELTIARQIAYSILRFEYKMKLIQIARMFKRDHTTIINGLKTHSNYMFSDEDYREKYEEILFLLKLKQNENGKPIPNA